MDSVTQALARLQDLMGTQAVVAFLLRLTLVVAIGRLVLAAAARASAATRHLIATSTLAIALLLPLATALLPEWRLALLPSEPIAERVRPSSPEMGSRPPALIATEYPRDPLLEPAAAAPGAGRPGGRSTARGALAPPAPPIPWPLALALLAIGVSELLLARLALSLFMAAAFTRRAGEVRDPRLRRAFDRASVRIGLRRSIELRITPRVSVPLVSGLTRPTLLLPVEAQAWSSDRLEVVFLHELAHVQRRDIVGLVLARSAAALYWFHPWVWALHLDARRECERACDDQVLRSGVRASDYAEQLLAIARHATGRDPRCGAVLALVGRSSLELRLRSILGAGVHRDGPSRGAMALAALLALLVLVPLATVRVTASPARAESALGRTGPTAPGTIATSPADIRAEEPEPDDALEAERWAGTVVVPAQHTPERTVSGSEWYSRASDFYERERYAAAARAFERAARGGCSIAKSLYNAACSYALNDEREPALTALGKAVDAGWDEVDLIESDDDLDSIRDDPRFDQILERARSIDPDEAEQAAARAEFEALRSSGSRDADAWGSAGMSLLRSGDAALATRAFEKQIGLESSSNAIYNLACAQAQNRETDAALATLEQAILAGYSSPGHMRGDADLAPLRRERRFGQLVRMAEDLELDFSLCSNSSRRWRDELSRYEDVTRKYPQAGRAWFNVGYAQIRAREHEASRASFLRALELDYRPATTMYNLACASAQLGESDEAMRWLDKSEEAGMRLEHHAPNDRDLTPLRNDPRFRALLRRLEDRGDDGLGSKIRRLFEKT